MELLECFISGEISSLHIRSFLPSNKYQKMIWWCYQHSELVPFWRGELGADRTYLVQTIKKHHYHQLSFTNNFVSRIRHRWNVISAANNFNLKIWFSNLNLVATKIPLLESLIVLVKFYHTPRLTTPMLVKLICRWFKLIQNDGQRIINLDYLTNQK